MTDKHELLTARYWQWTYYSTQPTEKEMNQNVKLRNAVAALVESRGRVHALEIDLATAAKAEAAATQGLVQAIRTAGEERDIIYKGVRYVVTTDSGSPQLMATLCNTIVLDE